MANTDLRSVVRLYARLQRRLARDCSGAGYVTCLVLTELKSAPLSQRELVSRLEIEKAWMSRTVKALLADGLVKRSGDDSDGRLSVLSLTEKGTQAADALEQRLTELNERLLDRLSANERKTVAAGLKALRRALEGV